MLEHPDAFLSMNPIELCDVRSLEDICSAGDVEEVHDDRSAALEGILMQGKPWVAIVLVYARVVIATGAT